MWFLLWTIDRLRRIFTGVESVSNSNFFFPLLLLALIYFKTVQVRWRMTGVFRREVIDLVLGIFHVLLMIMRPLAAVQFWLQLIEGDEVLEGGII